MEAPSGTTIVDISDPLKPKQHKLITKWETDGAGASQCFNFELRG